MQAVVVAVRLVVAAAALVGLAAAALVATAAVGLKELPELQIPVVVAVVVAAQLPLEVVAQEAQA